MTDISPRRWPLSPTTNCAWAGARWLTAEDIWRSKPAPPSCSFHVIARRCGTCTRGLRPDLSVLLSAWNQAGSNGRPSSGLWLILRAGCLDCLHTGISSEPYHLSVCPSVRPSRSGIVFRRMKIRSGINPSGVVKVRHSYFVAFVTNFVKVVD